MTTKCCRKCGDELGDENWSPSKHKYGDYICKECDNELSRKWKEANPEKQKAASTRYHRKEGHLPMSENKKCSLWLGVWIAERVLRHFFKDVQQMPNGNPGFDFICNKGMKVDSKSSCQNKDGRWKFNINHNTVADYFLCIAFDDRENLNPLHVWLIPGDVLNDLKTMGISPSNVHKWSEYEKDITGVSLCCDELKHHAKAQHHPDSNNAYTPIPSAAATKINVIGSGDGADKGVTGGAS